MALHNSALVMAFIMNDKEQYVTRMCAKKKLVNI